LIAYESDAAVAALARGEPVTHAFVRPRTIYYAAVLSTVAGFMIWGLTTRSAVVLEALRDRNPTFVRLHDGSVRNGFTLKIDNRSFERRKMQISLLGLAGAALKTPGSSPTQGAVAVTVEPNQVRAVRLLVTAPMSALAQQSLPITFELDEAGAKPIRTPSTFLSGDVAAQ
jgi:polyferredoxin